METRKINKVVGLALALTMATTISIPAFAADQSAQESKGYASSSEINNTSATFKRSRDLLYVRPDYGDVSWYICNSAGGYNENARPFSSPLTVPSAVKLTEECVGKYMKVVISNQAGSIIDYYYVAEVGAIFSKIELSYSELKVGQTIKVIVMPLDAPVSYQWYRLDAVGSSLLNGKIIGETASNYTITSADIGKRIAVVVSGQDAYEANITKITEGMVIDQESPATYKVTGNVKTQIVDKKDISLEMVNKTTGEKTTTNVGSGDVYTLQAKAGEYYIQFTTKGYLTAKVDVTVSADAAIPQVTMYVGDLTGDGKIDKEDYNILVDNLNKEADADGEVTSSDNNKYRLDVNGDGVVYGLDLGILLANMGRQTNK